MRVLRVEGIDGSGMYRPKDGSWFGAWDKANNVKYVGSDEVVHPIPSSDGIYLADKVQDACIDWYFGFKDEDQLLAWCFDDEHRQAMAKVGMSVSTYEVPDEYVQIGRRQVAFSKEHANLVQRDILE